MIEEKNENLSIVRDKAALLLSIGIPLLQCMYSALASF